MNLPKVIRLLGMHERGLYFLKSITLLTHATGKNATLDPSLDGKDDAISPVGL